MTAPSKQAPRDEPEWIDTAALSELIATSKFPAPEVQRALLRFLRAGAWHKVKDHETTDRIFKALRDERPEAVAPVTEAIVDRMRWSWQGELDFDRANHLHICFQHNDHNWYARSRPLETSSSDIYPIVEALAEQTDDVDAAGRLALRWLELGDEAALQELAPLLTAAERARTADGLWRWRFYGWDSSQQVVHRRLKLLMLPFDDDQQRLDWLCSQPGENATPEEKLSIAARQWLEEQRGPTRPPEINFGDGDVIEDDGWEPMSREHRYFELVHALSQLASETFHRRANDLLGAFNPGQVAPVLNALEVSDESIELEHKDEQGAKLWRLHRIGTTLLTHQGKRGRPGQFTTNVLATEAKARAAFKRHVTKKRKAWKLEE